MLSTKWKVYITPHPRGHFGRKIRKRVYVTELVNNYFRHSGTADMSLQQVQQRTPDLYKLNPDQIAAWKGEVGTKFHPLPRE